MFANPDELLFPNQFVNARLLVNTMQDTVRVPVPAVQRGAPGTFVYVINANNTVSVRAGEARADRRRLHGGAVGPAARREGGDRRRRPAARRRHGDGAAARPGHGARPAAPPAEAPGAAPGQPRPAPGPRRQTAPAQPAAAPCAGRSDTRRRPALSRTSQARRPASGSTPARSQRPPDARSVTRRTGAA